LKTKRPLIAKQVDVLPVLNDIPAVFMFPLWFFISSLPAPEVLKSVIFYYIFKSWKIGK